MDLPTLFILYFLSIVSNCQLGSLDRKCKLSVFERQVHVQKTGIVGDGGALALHRVSSSVGKGITGVSPRERRLYHRTRSWHRDRTTDGVQFHYPECDKLGIKNGFLIHHYPQCEPELGKSRQLVAAYDLFP